MNVTDALAIAAGIAAIRGTTRDERYALGDVDSNERRRPRPGWPQR